MEVRNQRSERCDQMSNDQIRKSNDRDQMSNDQIRKLNDRDQMSRESDPKSNVRNHRSSNRDYSSSDRENIPAEPEDISSDRDNIPSDRSHFPDNQNQKPNNNDLVMKDQYSKERHSGPEDRDFSDQNAESNDQTKLLNRLIQSKELENSDNHGRVEVYRESGQYGNSTNLSDDENETTSKEVMIEADLNRSSDSSQTDETRGPDRNCVNLSDCSVNLENKHHAVHRFKDTSDKINTEETWLPPDPEVIIASKDTAQTRSEVSECLGSNEQETGIITKKTSNMGIDKLLASEETSLTLESEIFGTEKPDMGFYFGMETTKQEQDRLDRLYSKLFESIGVDLEEGIVTYGCDGLETESEENSQIDNSSAKSILHNDWNEETISASESSWNAEFIPVSQKLWNEEAIPVSDDYWIDESDFYGKTTPTSEKNKSRTSANGIAVPDSEFNVMLEPIQEHSYPDETHRSKSLIKEIDMIAEPEMELSDEHICSDSFADQFQSDLKLQRKPKYLPPYSEISHSKNKPASNSESKLESKPESKLESKPDSKLESKPE